MDFQPSNKMINKVKASVFFQTNLNEALLEQRINSLVVIGKGTSGGIQASAVDGFSLGYLVPVVENYVFDQNSLSHVVNL